MNMIETPTLAPSSEAPDMTQIDKTSTKTSRKNVLQKVAKLLSLPTQEDLDDFQFYVYDDIPNHYQPKTISKCVEDYGIRNSFQNKTNVSDVERQRRQQNFYDTYCDWSTSICSPKAYTTSCHYSDRRLNRNADAILATHFVQYTGPLRTYDPESAKIFIVPYPASSQKECYRISSSKYNKKLKATITDHERTLLKSLKYWKQHPTKHLFLYSAGLDQSYLLEYVQSRHNNMIAMLGPKRRLGHIVIPYANTHPEYQPNQFFQLQLQPDELNQRHSKTASINQSTSPFKDKRYALSAVLSKDISGNGQIRKQFLDNIENYFPNRQIGGMPIRIIEIDSGQMRRLPNETDVMRLYRDSIFCPIFRGDSPIQKRFFDAILSGCIPVVMAYYNHNRHETSMRADTNRTATQVSYFSDFLIKNRHGALVEDTYPLAMIHDDFQQNANRRSSSLSVTKTARITTSNTIFSSFGIDYSKLVIEIQPNGCLECIANILENLLSNQTRLLQEKQAYLAKMRTLFSYGMESNFLLYPDAVSSLLLQAKYYAESMVQLES